MCSILLYTSCILLVFSCIWKFLSFGISSKMLFPDQNVILKLYIRRLYFLKESFYHIGKLNMMGLGEQNFSGIPLCVRWHQYKCFIQPILYFISNLKLNSQVMFTLYYTSMCISVFPIHINVCTYYTFIVII